MNRKPEVKNPYKTEMGYSDPVKAAAFEEGADAILEAIGKLAKESPTGTFTFDSNMIQIYDGEND